MSVLSIRVLQNTQKVVICGRDSPNTQLSSIRPWTITAAYFYVMYVTEASVWWMVVVVMVAEDELESSARNSI